MALVLFENTFLVDAEPYLEQSPVWDTLSDSEKEKALRDATAILNERDWLGVASSTSQPLAWGREQFSFHDSVLGLEVTVETDTVPIRLEKAVSAQALHLVTYPSLDSRFASSFDKIKLGPLEIENTDADSTQKVPLVPLSVKTMIAPLTHSGSGQSAFSTGAWWRAN